MPLLAARTFKGASPEAVENSSDFVEFVTLGNEPIEEEQVLKDVAASAERIKSRLEKCDITSIPNSQIDCEKALNRHQSA